MNKSKNTFLKSKMNKDIDARILPNNEYRNAVNVQVNKSEGSNVGSLENVLGNVSVASVTTHTGVADLKCIGTLQDESTGITYLFFTDNTKGEYYPTGQYSKHFIISFNSNNNSLITLVQGSFLNFYTGSPVYGSNIIENLLFWTDNRNQPRKINVDFANTNSDQSPTYYTTEDQISVAKYNPHNCIEMYAESKLSTAVTTEYESTMKDVSSKNLPNGGNGELNAAVASGDLIMIIKNFVGDIQVTGATTYDSTSSISYIDASNNVQLIPSTVISSAVYDTGNSLWTITIDNNTSFPALDANTVIILNANPYYDSQFAGDPTYLDDKFVRFAYRFKFDDNEYSLFSTFTQAAFIPKQDGYFMYVQKDDLKKVNNESEASRSTIVNFVENKVDQIKLRIPLPFKNYNLRDSLKVTEIDILYKESDQIPVKVIDTINANDIYNASASCQVKTATVGAQTTVAVDNIVGGIKIGSYVTGFGITTNVTVVAYNPDNPNVNPSTVGTIALSSAQTLAENVELTIGEPDYHVYDYQSKKPFRTLPEKDLIRVFDKTPIRALAQEISGNRVIYGNYLNKYTAPEFINYNLAITDKSAFGLNGGTAQILGSFPIGSTIIDLTSIKGEFLIGMEVISDGVAPGTLITAISGSTITLDTPTIGILVNLQLVVLEPGGTEQNTTSRIEYPSSSLKTNRNYQVGIVLSDRYGRQSGVILSNNKEVSVSGTQTFIGSTIYSPYNTPTTQPNSWPGDSIKLIFNNQIATEYNSDVTSPKYNPLGWYSYKIVVKQTEQEYYNVYLPGIMSGYPENLTLEQGQTSHVVLTSDNINKIPRDLNEVGPTQDQFRSSVKLYGRVENSPTLVTTNNFGLSNLQYYPGREFDIAITISPLNDLFDYNQQDPPTPNFFPQFYTYNSNPYIARISTASKIGQLANTNYTAVSGFASIDDTSDTIRLYNVSGDTAGIALGDSVTGPGFPEDLTADTASPFAGAYPAGQTNVNTGSTGLTLFFQNPVTFAAVGQVLTGAGIASGTVVTDIQAGGTEIIMNQIASVISNTPVLFTSPATLIVNQAVTFQEGDAITISSQLKPGIQYLAVYETEPVQSLLDIFWESSSTGIIQDINNIILNENTGGVAAGSLAPFNTNVFKEDLRQDPVTNAYPNITVAPFGLVDNFEQPIPSGSINTPLSLDRVENGYGENVQTVYQNGGTITPVFSFAEVGSSGLYNIKIAEGFGRNIYFGEDALLHTFIFFFSATVNNLETFFEREAILRNVQPYFYTWEGTSFKALRTQTAEATASGFKFDVYNEGPSASNIIPGFKVYNNTTPAAFQSNLVTAGTSFTIPPNINNNIGYPNNPISAAPFPTGSTQTSTQITFGTESWSVFGNPTVAINNLVLFDPNFTIQASSSIPAGTFVTAFADGTAGSGTRTATFSNSITTTHVGTGFTIFGEGEGDAMQFWTPNYLEVSASVNVTAGDLIYVFDTPNWGNCPIGPVYTGSANLELITTIQGVNGAGFNIDDLFGTNQGLQKWRDLTCTIVSVINSNDEDADQYFGLSNQGLMTQNLAGLGEVNLLNIGYQNNSMPADVYRVNLRLDDPSDFDLCQVIVNTGLQLCTNQLASQFGDHPYGVQEYTVTATGAGLPAIVRKYLFVSICEGAAGQDPLFGGNGSNGYWLWIGGSDGETPANPSWDNCIGSNGGTNILLEALPNTPNPYTSGSACSGGWIKGFAWDDFGGISGGRSALLAMPCVDLAPGYQTSITQIKGTGSGIPLTPSVENYVFTI